VLALPLPHCVTLAAHWSLKQLFEQQALSRVQMSPLAMQDVRPV
jgi:hypothetical protein